ncbi:hypothetical protein [Fontivita pretiosa]|jgi:hypothetical protein|uniref:hypothetical protein n=1 Tax=Fontivita pretiosa TaxID=2989684 RepID=UPI003D184AE1
MRPIFRTAALAAALFGISQAASAQSVTFDFEDGTDQGFGHKFGSGDASETFPVVSIGGSMRMAVLRDGDFQEAERIAGADGSPFYLAMKAAAADEANYFISYDYYIDTSAFGSGAGTFLQLGTYVNTGSGYYAQDFPGAGKDVELSGTDLASGGVFSGTVTESFAAKGYDMPAADTFFRLGLIINGDGANQVVHFDNIRVFPEPASLALVSLAVLPILRRRRSRSA